jgi:hypothetical protein
MKPIAYLMVERNTQERYVQTNTPTRAEKISHQPYPLYHLEDGVRVYNNREEYLSESFDRTASHMAGEYVSYADTVIKQMQDISPEDRLCTHEEQEEWLRTIRKTGY